MQVKLVATTQPAPEFVAEHGDAWADLPPKQASESLVAYMARVSNPSNQNNLSTIAKLLGYLIRKKHWSPFDMAHMVLEITTSRGMSHEIIRHRSFCFQEFSQRYAEVITIEQIELRKQAEQNRQSSEEIVNPTLQGVLGYNSARVRVDSIVSQVLALYKEMIEAGVSRETARMVLPAAAETTIYMSGSVRSWIHYIDTRVEGSTQKEHRLIADECKKIFVQQFPNITEALQWR